MPQKILAMKLRAMGDTVLVTAPLLALRQAYPKAELHVAVLKAWAPLLENFPGVSRIWTYERHKEMGARAKALTRMALQLRKEQYDCVVNFHASPSSATLSFATGAKLRSIHFHGHRDKNRHSTVQIPSKGVVKPNIERDMDAVRALGVEVPAGRLPQIFLRDSERAHARSWLEQRGLTGPLLGLGLGASRPAKAWPLERFARVATEWCEKRKGSALVLVGPQETGLAKEFLKLTGPKIQAETGLALRELGGVLSHCSVFLGNDSGPRHLALAVGAPTVTLFGPEDPLEWHPYPKDRHPLFFVEGLACRRDADPGQPPWCGLQSCVVEKHRCMTEISEKQVLDRCLEVSPK